MIDFKVLVSGLSREERRRILKLIERAISADRKYKWVGGTWPFDGYESVERYAKIDKANIYNDMSVEACAARYDDKRQAILQQIQYDDVSPSMSGIDDYSEDWCDLKIGTHHDREIKTALTWNGEYHIDRPDWKQDYIEWKEKQ